eukprot:TRINITY_DN4402_c0_g2_i1.p1 TRINITY_DN4402_c0_g2~~TRINITY_DN4402_c0_g2_i1.p1  ORF type:complete len:515 (+),score=141.76 TRINITY_DN4402_c0_g2_i1:52-1596(+)
MLNKFRNSSLSQVLTLSAPRSTAPPKSPTLKLKTAQNNQSSQNHATEPPPKPLETTNSTTTITIQTNRALTLYEKIHILEIQVKDLQQQVLDGETSLQELEKIKTAHDSTVASLHEELTEARQTQQITEDKYHENQALVIRLQIAQNTLQEQVLSLRHQLQANEQDRVVLSSEVAVLTERNQNLEAELLETQKKLGHLSRRTRSFLHKKNEDLRTENVELHSMILDLKREREAAQNLAVERDQLLTERDQIISDLEDSAQRSTFEVDRANRQHDREVTRMSEKLQDAELRIRQQQGLIDRLERKVATLQENSQRNEAIVAERDREIELLNTKLFCSRQENEHTSNLLHQQIEQNLEDGERNRLTQQQLKKELNDMKLQVDEAERFKEKYYEQRRKMKKRLKSTVRLSYNSSDESKPKLEQEIADLRAQIERERKEADLRINRLQADLEAKTKVFAQALPEDLESEVEKEPQVEHDVLLHEFSTLWAHVESGLLLKSPKKKEPDPVQDIASLFHC